MSFLKNAVGKIKEVFIKKKKSFRTTSSATSYNTFKESYNLPHECNVKISDFKLMSVLGKGSFGKVVMARYEPKKTYHAVKAVRRNKIGTIRKFELILNEKNILYCIKHPFIVRLDYTAKDVKNLYFIMEYVDGGELFYHLSTVGHFTETQVKFFASQLIMVIEYLHSLNIIHRDIKPENLILDKHGYLKLADFGFAKVVETRTYTMCGTPEYIAPEIINMQGYSKSVDWWTLGVLLFELSTGDPPFEDEDQVDLFKKIITKEYIIPEDISYELRDIIEKLMANDMTRRYGNTKGGAKKIKEHKFFKRVKWEKIYKRQVMPPYKPSKIVIESGVKDLMKEGMNLIDFKANKKDLTSISNPAELEQFIEQF